MKKLIVKITLEFLENDFKELMNSNNLTLEEAVQLRLHDKTFDPTVNIVDQTQEEVESEQN